MEEPPASHDDVDTVEFQQDCARCGEPVITVFSVVYALREVLPA